MYISVKEYCHRWSLSESTVRHAIREGRLTAYKIGRIIRIPHDAIIEAPVIHSAIPNFKERVKML